MSRHGYPVSEIFGPTVQGEGPDAGRPCYFVRLGGCDYRCSWCDSLYAVDPAQVRALERMSPHTICQRLGQLEPGPTMVVLSGGNPALHELGPLLAELQPSYEVSVETQGSVWRDWLHQVDRLVVSPKPPSSGMATPEHRVQFDHFMSNVYGRFAAPRACLKIVVFDEIDLGWARNVAADYPQLPLYLSAGTPQDLADAETRQAVMGRFRWLCEAVSREPALCEAKVLPQLHVLAWGTARGV